MPSGGCGSGDEAGCVVIEWSLVPGFSIANSMSMKSKSNDYESHSEWQTYRELQLDSVPPSFLELFSVFSVIVLVFQQFGIQCLAQGSIWTRAISLFPTLKSENFCNFLKPSVQLSQQLHTVISQTRNCGLTFSLSLFLDKSDQSEHLHSSIYTLHCKCFALWVVGQHIVQTTSFLA